MHSLIPQLFATLGACIGAFSQGSVVVWSSNALQHIPEEILGNSKEWVVSIFMIGAGLVPWFATLAFEYFGKKWTLVAVSFPFIGGWLLLLLARNTAMLLLGRFITGFCGGMFILAAPAYSSEIAETKYRGALGSLMQVMVCLGMLFVNFNCSTDWRVLSGLCIIFPALMAVWMFFVPRSPEFLVTKGKLEEAKSSLQWFRGGSSVNVEKELKEIENNVEDRRRGGEVTVRRLVTQARYARPLATVLTLMALQQLSGINYILGYSTLIMESAGTSLGECVSTMLLGSVQLLGSVATIFLIDKFGRKMLLIISEVFICLSMLGVAIFFLLSENCDECHNGGSGNGTSISTTTTILPELSISKSTLDEVGFLPLVSLMMFLAVFFLGLGPIPFILNVELIPPEARALSSSFAISFNWVISFLVAQFIPSIGEALGNSSCYFMFSGIALMGTFFVIFLVPETKGKSEDEIRALFQTKDDTESLISDNNL